MDEKPTVRVPDALNLGLAIIQDLQRDTQRIDVSVGARPRAMLVIQDLAGQCERRGYTIALASDDSPGLLIDVHGRDYRLLMNEEWDTLEQLPNDAELDDPKVYSWQRIRPQARRVRSGRLRLEIVGDEYRFKGRSRSWADRRRWRLEDKLGDVLTEVQARAEIDERAHIAAELAAAHRLEQWEQAMARARILYADHHRIEALTQQIDAWTQARAARAYAAALRHTTPVDSGLDALDEWIDWISDYADRIDPLLPSPKPPPPVGDPRPEDLRAFLKGHSPYGPGTR